ncbi:uncharacterized protein G2W53_018161 [Senna tora]|uniref:Uncharacterized protein n=1 Tax=Senna tora TaxID=362788 RepID=A0A834TS57_9FABA|nr:uncharacterized protein G2W53_018161 [Senna tora]
MAKPKSRTSQATRKHRPIRKWRILCAKHDQIRTRKINARRGDP